MDNQFNYQNQNQDFQNPPKKGLPKLIFIILGAVIIVELLIGAKTLLTPVAPIPVVKQTVSQVVLSEGVINLSSPKSLYGVAEIIPLSIKVSTGNHLTSGVDLVLKYDPSMLEASGSSLVKGSAFDDYPQINIDSKNGILRASGVISPTKLGFNGSGDFGVINFTAKSKGITTISLEFSPEVTGDSNMVELETNKDILGKVTEVKLNIQ